jgi:hypothetical protein
MLLKKKEEIDLLCENVQNMILKKKKQLGYIKFYIIREIWLN